MKKLTLEDRVARLERLIKEDETQASEKGPEDYLRTLQKMIFKNKKLNPKGLPAEEHSRITKVFDNPTLIVDNEIGNWYLYIEIPLTLDEESKNEFKKMVGVFCKINKCLVDFSINDMHSNREETWFELKKWPTQPAPEPKPKPVRQPSKRELQWQKEREALREATRKLIKAFQDDDVISTIYDPNRKVKTEFMPNVATLDMPVTENIKNDNEKKDALKKLLKKYLNDNDYYTFDIEDYEDTYIRIMIGLEAPDFPDSGEYRNPDDMWEDPDYQDMRKSAAYSRHGRYW